MSDAEKILELESWSIAGPWFSGGGWIGPNIKCAVIYDEGMGGRVASQIAAYRTLAPAVARRLIDCERELAEAVRLLGNFAKVWTGDHDGTSRLMWSDIKAAHDFVSKHPATGAAGEGEAS